MLSKFLFASLLGVVVYSVEECTEDLANAFYYEFFADSCQFCVCQCEQNTATGDVDCEYNCIIDWDETNPNSLEYIGEYCLSDPCSNDQLVFDDSSDDCDCSRVSCSSSTNPTDPDVPESTRNGNTNPTDPDDSDDPNATEDPDKQTQRPVVTTDDDGDDSDEPNVTEDDRDVTDEPEPTTDADRVTEEPERTDSSDEHDDDDDDDNRVTDEPKETEESDESDDSNDDDDRVTESPDDSDDDDKDSDDRDSDDYDISSSDQDDFLDDDNDVESVDSDDASKPYLVLKFEFELTRFWYYRPDVYAILKRALRVLLSDNDDYDTDVTTFFVVEFDAELNDDTIDEDCDGVNCDTNEQSISESIDDDEANTGNNDDDTDANTSDNDNGDGSDGSDANTGANSDDDDDRVRRLIKGRRLLEDDVNASDSDSTREPENTESSDEDDNNNNDADSDRVTESPDSDDDDDNDDDDAYKTTVNIDDQCDDVSLTVTAGIAVYIDDIDVVERIYNWLLELADALADEFGINCQDSAELYRSCGWGDVTVLSAAIAYYDENGQLVESETYIAPDSDDNPSGTSDASIANIGMGVVTLLSGVSLFNLW